MIRTAKPEGAMAFYLNGGKVLNGPGHVGGGGANPR
jgi:hypothetical protein